MLCVAALLTVLVVLVLVLLRRCPGQALRAMRARPANEIDHPQLSALVRDVSSRAGLPVPTLFISPTPVPNAFAVGRGRARTALCCTEGLLARLDERQLRAVVAHELAHVRSGDTRIGSLAGVVATVRMPAGLARLIVRPSVSRRRELAADLAAARLTGDPMGLASALRALESAARRWQLPAERSLLTCAHLMTVDPLPARGPGSRWTTHPETSVRVARLEQLAGYRR